MEKHIKQIARELKRIRVELEKMNKPNDSEFHVDVNLTEPIDLEKTLNEIDKPATKPAVSI